MVIERFRLVITAIAVVIIAGLAVLGAQIWLMNVRIDRLVTKVNDIDATFGVRLDETNAKLDAVSTKLDAISQRLPAKFKTAPAHSATSDPKTLSFVSCAAPRYPCLSLRPRSRAIRSDLAIASPSSLNAMRSVGG